MKWSYKIGRFFGIDVFVHVTFLLVLALIAYLDWRSTRSLQAVLSGTAYFLALFLCVLLHEYGHALTARKYGVKTKDIILLPIGGVARLEKIPDKPMQEFWVAVAGPAVNVVIAGVIAIYLTATNSFLPFWEMLEHGSFFQRLFATNILLILFNMIPAFPMDGGRVLRSLLALRMEYGRATRIAANVGQMLALVFGIAGFMLGHLFLMLIAFFVWMGAGQEAAATEMKVTIGGVPVSSAMLTEYHTLAPGDTLAGVARLLIMGSQRDFPVVDNGTVVGILTHTKLVDALRTAGETALVGEVMDEDFRTARPDDRLESLLAQSESGMSLIPVIIDGRLVGLVTPENVGELFIIRAARAQLAVQRRT